jgi:hypothetical protein
VPLVVDHEDGLHPANDTVGRRRPRRPT